MLLGLLYDLVNQLYTCNTGRIAPKPSIIHEHFFVWLQENMMLKEQMEVFVRENTILKRAVAIQHERQKEYEVKNQELQHLKQLLPQYQEQLRVLEVWTTD